MFVKEVLVGGQQFFDHIVVHFLALDVPHLLVDAQMAVGVKGFFNLIFAANLLISCEERHVDVVGVLGAHTTGNCHFWGSCGT